MNCKYGISFPNGKNKKHFTSSVAKKGEFLKKYDQGTPMQNFNIEYGIGKLTVYGTIKQKKNIFSSPFFFFFFL